jgi:hypothetical protein
METIQIEIRQQNESVQLYNVYVGYNKKYPQLHSMALSYEEAERLAFNIIKANQDYKPEILIDKF